MSAKCLNLMNINPTIRETDNINARINKYVLETEDSLKKGTQKHNFEEIIRADLGIAQDPDHAPITFARQVMASISLPQLMNDKKFPLDVKRHVEELLNDCQGRSIGAYTEALGMDVVRKHAAEFIEKRDGFPSRYENIFIGSGSHYIIEHLLQLFDFDNDGKPSGVMTPIPGPPLYSWTIAQHHMKKINYYLKNDDEGWSIDVEELKRAVDEARKCSCPRVIIINNPGNPTGQILTKKNIEDIIKLSFEENLFIVADEIYQNNIYSNEKEFVSFKKVLCELGSPFDGMQLASVMSSSKGYMGECGARGGYVELLNVDPEERYIIYKLLSSNTCPAIGGQIFLDCLMNPPRQGDPSYERFIEEKSEILASHTAKVQFITESLKRIKGISSHQAEGAPYAYAKVEIPKKAVEEAKRMNVCPSEMYTINLFRRTGICVSPGSIFGQKPGSYFFRMSALLPNRRLKFVASKIQEFHASFMMKYS